MSTSSHPVLLIGSTETCPDIAWLTGFNVHDPVVLLVDGRKRHLVVPQLEYGRALKQTTGIHIHIPENLPIPKSSRGRFTGWAEGILKHTSNSSVIVPSDFPLGVAEDLRRRRIKVNSTNDRLFPKRETKTADELKKIKGVQQAAAGAVNVVVDLIKQSTVSRSKELKLGGKVLTSERLKTAANTYLLERQCFCDNLIIASGRQAADPHDTGSGPIKARETVIIDIFPKSLVHGYCGDITRTVVKGEPTDEQMKMYKAVFASHAAALKKVKAGIASSSVHGAAADVFKERDFFTGMRDGLPVGFFHSTGHGLGLEVHEMPSVSIRPGRLKSGNVITIEPGLYYPEHGGVRIEDTIAVTKDGYSHLARCPKAFIV